MFILRSSTYLCKVKMIAFKTLRNRMHIRGVCANYAHNTPAVRAFLLRRIFCVVSVHLATFVRCSYSYNMKCRVKASGSYLTELIKHSMPSCMHLPVCVGGLTSAKNTCPINQLGKEAQLTFVSFLSQGLRTGDALNTVVSLCEAITCSQSLLPFVNHGQPHAEVQMSGPACLIS